MSEVRVLLAGHVTHDRHAGGISAGGCAFYAAEVYRRLGARAHVATAVGLDFAFDELLARGPHTATRGGQTTVFANLYGAGGARVQLVEGAAPEVSPAALAPEDRGADIVHLAPVIGEIDIAAWRRATRARILAIGVQGWVRRAGAPVDGGAASWARGRRVDCAPWAIEPEELAGVHAAFASDEDLVGQGDLLERLCAAVPVVVVTRGERGSEVMEQAAGGRRTRVGVYPTQAVDATGAGDTFAAGFLWQLARGANPVAAARFGAAAASIAVEGAGASALDRLGEAAARAEGVPVY